MSKIKVMSEELANRIAAGEVIERISNVVKELIENAIDAESKTIKVELMDAGKKEIKITDDGIGMDASDAKECFKRHATSKIYKDDDLFFINTLGFRGEALPSIASVSEVTLETYDGKVGTKIHIKGGELLDVGIAPSRQGTIITVTNLFYNTPARLKYLKSEPAELANVTSFIERLSLSHPDISFTLYNNEKRIVRSTGSGDLLKTIHEIYGANIATNMIPVKASNDDYDIIGYISKPIIQRSTKNFINTFINGRVIKNFELNKYINDAYYTYKPDNTYPIVVINIETDPTLIDVNVHPTKQDIKFSKQGELKDLITKTIKDALYSELLIPDALYNKKEREAHIEEDTREQDEEMLSMLPKTLFNDTPLDEDEPRGIIIEDRTPSINKDEQKVYPKGDDKKDTISMQFDFKEKNKEIASLELYPVGIAHGTYIIAENDEGVYLIDQHAAVERINYEDVLKGLLSKNSQDLLVPIVMEFTSSEMEIIESNREVLSSIGLEYEEFGINTINITRLPTWIKEGVEEPTIRTIFDILFEDNGFDPLKFNDKVAATIACKKSLKGNTRITLELAGEILKKLVLCDNPYNCPHGRPTIIKFTKYELEKMFKRAM